MINLFVTCDDNDYNLGEYFTKSYTWMKSQIKYPSIVELNINGLSCTLENINEHVVTMNSQHFICVAFSHGTDEDLIASDIPYISSANSHNFKQSLFYTSACSCSSVLGKTLVQQGCHAFVGYNGEVKIHPDYEEIFIECENSGIIEFLNSEKTLIETYNEMRNTYENKISELLEGDTMETFIASTLVDNLTKLEIIGNTDLTINDFILEN